MKKTILKISMAIAVLMFVFTGISWAEGGKNRQRQRGSEPRIHSKQDRGKAYHAPARYQHKNNRHHKRVYQKQHKRQKFYHRNKWIQKNRRNQRHRWYKKLRRHHRPVRYYGDNAYDNAYEDDPSSNEFSIAATIYEPGVEFSIGAKRTW
jgi:hypothetical protein